jgi:DNA-binding protein YbaB
VKKLKDILNKTAESLDAFTHPRVSIAWQDRDLVFRKVHNPSPDLEGSIIGKTIEDVVKDQPQAKKLSARKRKILETGEPWHDVVQVTLGGNKHFFDVSIEPSYNEDGVLEGLVDISIDVTDLVTAREQLKEANVRLIKLLDDAMHSSPHQKSRLERNNSMVGNEGLEPPTSSV